MQQNISIKLKKAYDNRKEAFHKYIDEIKKSVKPDLYNVVNVTLVKNPFNSNFPKNFFLRNYSNYNIFFIFLKSMIMFYVKQFFYFFSYVIAFILYKIFYKQENIDLNNAIGIDIFFIVDNIIKEKQFDENYFRELYEVLEKYNQKYVFLPRLYGSVKNPFKLKELFRVINEDRRNFLFEFEFLSFFDFISIFFMILIYPFKTLRLLQKEKNEDDRLFNNELLNDITNLGSDVFNRYIYGKNISNTKLHKIYSWSEFQVVERSFNYAVRTKTDKIELIGCQLHLNFETYFNAYITDIDYDMYSSPHRVLVNGKYYVLDRKKVKYNTGVSLRYKNVLLCNSKINPKNIVLLGTFLNETKYMLDCMSDFDEVLFKKHPITEIKQFSNIGKNITVVNDNIYELFKNASVIISTASGTALEAVACGVTVIVIANKDNLTANPLVEYGKGKIWDIAYDKREVKELYENLVKYRINNEVEMQEIASWYKDNFFVDSTEENIVKVFELEGKL